MKIFCLMVEQEGGYVRPALVSLHSTRELAELERDGRSNLEVQELTVDEKGLTVREIMEKIMAGAKA